jgi:hypothetical protein
MDVVIAYLVLSIYLSGNGVVPAGNAAREL